MKTTFHRPAAPLLACLLVALVACEAQKSSNPLSPSVAGPIAGVEITVPVLLEPAQGFKYKESQQPIKLVIQNATSNGVRPITYTFEVATDNAFGAMVFARASVAPGDGGKTSVVVDRLDLGRAYYWRARADDGANTSQYASSQFEVLPKPDLSVPGLVSPINNERVTSSSPTLTVSNSSRNAAVGDVRYQFQVATDAAFTGIAASGEVAEGGGRTEYVVGGALTANLTYYWRARATDGETTTSWSGGQTFRTPVATTPTPTPGPSPSPGGGSCALGNGPAIVACIAAKYAAWRAPVGSVGERQTNMKFLRDRIIEAGKCSGLDYGWNLKRGGPELSIDVIAWRRNDGNMGVDIAYDYDNYSSTLQLGWSEIDLFAAFAAYPTVSCGGV